MERVAKPIERASVVFAYKAKELGIHTVRFELRSRVDLVFVTLMQNPSFRSILESSFESTDGEYALNFIPRLKPSEALEWDISGKPCQHASYKISFLDRQVTCVADDRGEFSVITKSRF